MKQPSLSVNGVVVYFKDAEEHTQYIIFELGQTRAEIEAHECAFSKAERVSAASALGLARARAHDEWLTQRGE